MSFEIGSRETGPASVGAIADVLAKSSTGTLGHLTDFGFARGVGALFRPSRVVGPCFTVRIPTLDATAVHYALNLIEPGEVLVIDTCGETTRAVWGGVVAHAALRAGVAGTIVDGPVTDWDELREVGLPVWCRGVTSLTGRGIGLEGSVLAPVQIGGAVVMPGDIAFADSDGVYFIPREKALTIGQTLVERDLREPKIKARLDQGEKLADITGARQRVEEMMKHS